MPTVFLYVDKDEVEVMARMVSDDGLVGDLREVVKPGETFWGWTYQELRDLGTGEHDIEERAE